jgi:N-methylhydantoinase A
VTVPIYQPHEDGVQAAKPSSPAPKGTRQVYFDARTPLATAIYERDRIDIGAGVKGPAIVEQFDATTVVPPGWTARVNSLRNLVIERG